ncbi:uncharacterized protein LOC118198898 [Stegodyphus dumicola]|uniref:uncharacterized protein LOC118198898 n=1 Tax=Stegodyphus dumicola TaxID=202533 RepID=UPI0015AA8EF5|nr:uncharacterized protein LOC118198898 [Stegodyphus dumicola]
MFKIPNTDCRMEMTGWEVFNFSWSIEKVSMCPHSAGEFLCSPSFVVHSLPGLSWHLNLYPRGNEEADFKSVYLMRNNICGTAVSHIFTVGVGTALKGEDMVLNRIEEMQCLIRINYNWEYVKNPDILIIKLALKPLNKIKHDILPSLSYENGLFADAVVCARDFDFRVHKAILWARWPKLAEKLEAEATCKTVLDIEPDVLNAMINYVYTGKLDKNTTDIKAKLPAAAAKHELPKLHCMDVVTQEVCTHINVEEVSFHCNVDRLINMPNNTEFCSDVFYIDMFESCRWYLIIRKKTKTDSERIHYDVSLCNTYGSKFKPLFVRSNITYDNSHYSVNEHLFRKNENWVCGTNSSHPSLSPFSLRCEFKFSDYHSFSKIIKSRKLQSNNLDTLHFSSDLRNLYKTGKLSDITITVGSKIFSAHKSIVCARSAVFCRMFETEMKESVRNSVDISDVDPDIMDDMLLYMYSGCLSKPLDDDRAEELYAVADKYEISALKEKCSTYFISRLSASNVYRVLQLANLRSDDNLHKQAVEFLSQEEYIFSAEEWKTFSIHNGSVAAKVLQEVRFQKKRKNN